MKSDFINKLMKSDREIFWWLKNQLNTKERKNIRNEVSSRLPFVNMKQRKNIYRAC